MFRGIATLCILQLSFLAGTAHSQERDSVTMGNHKFLYGIHLGYTHDLRYTCGLGVDWYTRLVRVGVELKAGFDLLPPNTDGSGLSRHAYFHAGPTFSIGINIEA